MSRGELWVSMVGRFANFLFRKSFLLVTLSVVSLIENLLLNIFCCCCCFLGWRVGSICLNEKSHGFKLKLIIYPYMRERGRFILNAMIMHRVLPFVVGRHAGQGYLLLFVYCSFGLFVSIYEPLHIQYCSFLQSISSCKCSFEWL